MNVGGWTTWKTLKKVKNFKKGKMVITDYCPTPLKGYLQVRHINNWTKFCGIIEIHLTRQVLQGRAGQKRQLSVQLTLLACLSKNGVKIALLSPFKTGRRKTQGKRINQTFISQFNSKALWIFLTHTFDKNFEWETLSCVTTLWKELPPVRIVSGVAVDRGLESDNFWFWSL